MDNTSKIEESNSINNLLRELDNFNAIAKQVLALSQCVNNNPATTVTQLEHINVLLTAIDNGMDQRMEAIVNELKKQQ